jgi:hypothetical protein
MRQSNLFFFDCVDRVVDGGVREPGPLVQAGDVEHSVRQSRSLRKTKTKQLIRLKVIFAFASVGKRLI